MADTRERRGKRRSTVPRHASTTVETERREREGRNEQPGTRSPVGRDERLIGTERFPRKGDDQ
jgi:hypothetical protein